jgi:hypothetical protein
MDGDGENAVAGGPGRGAPAGEDARSTSRLAAGCNGDALSVLRCAPGFRATKRVTYTKRGPRIDGYDAGKHFAVGEVAVGGIHELAAALDVVSREPRAFVIRAEPLPGVDRTRCRRLVHSHREDDGTITPPTFREVPCRWVVIDFDKVPGPYRFDPRDGELAAIYCRTLLPPPWHQASYWWGLSSSAGFKPGVRIKLAFWLDRPMLGAELERHLTGCPVDPATHRPVQAIYVAQPILVDVADPIRVRSGIIEDVRNDVQLPELPAEALAGPGKRWVSGQPASVAERRLAALCMAIERAAVGGRHRCLMWAATRAVELDARRAGLDDHEADLARQIKNAFRIGIFGSGAAA